MIMIEKIKEEYGEFCDSWISNIEIQLNEIDLIVTCANKLKNYTYETIQLSFKEVKFYQIDNNYFIDNYVIKNALIEESNKSITIDLDAIDYFDYLKENEFSTFKIKCGKISYKVIGKYNG